MFNVRWAILGLGTLVACGAIAACGGDDNGSGPSSEGGASGSSSGGSSGTTSGASSGASSGATSGSATSGTSSGATTGATTGSASGSASGASDAGAEGGASTLYSRLGEHAGIRGAINAIVAAELADPDIQTYFFNQVASPVPAGHPTADQIEECFTDLLASLAGGSETYPTTVVTLTDAGADAGSFACRADMVAIHAPLKISGGTFDKFIMIAGGVLTSAMGTGPYTYTSADITTIAMALTGQKSKVVDPAQADAGLQAYPGADAQ